MTINLNRKNISRKILAIVAACATLGAINFFEPATLLLNTIQSTVRSKPVSGDIVVVGIDSPSIREVGRWPWTRDKQAELLRQLDSYNAKEIYLDIGYQGKTSHQADKALRDTIEKMKTPTAVIALSANGNDETAETIYSHNAAVGNARTVTSYLPYLFGYVWSIPTAIDTNRGPLESVASSIAKLENQKSASFRIDYGFNPQTIPTYAAKDIFAKTVLPQKIAGKTVVVGIIDVTQNDIHSMPGWGERPGVLFHVLGAETLKQGYPANWGWLPFFAFAMAAAALQFTKKGLKYSASLSWAGIAAVFCVSSWMVVNGINNDPLPAAALIASAGIFVAKQKAALKRSQRNNDTGFADMAGYEVAEVVSNNFFIGASLRRSETRRGYVLDADSLKIMKEVGRRLSSIIDEKQLTHNDNQQFLWEVPRTDITTLGDHLEGLRRLFAAPILIDGRKIDLDIFFGIDRDLTANVNRRKNSALIASQGARDESATFKIATSASFEEHLTKNFATEFASAIGNLDITVMLEGQRDLSTNSIAGADVTLSWKHPAYGEIGGNKLISMAVAANCYDNLVLHLCNQTIECSRTLVRTMTNFTLSLAIDTATLRSQSFKKWLADSMAAPTFRCGTIIFKITDAHENEHLPELKAAIRTLKEHGFRVGIGTFGKTNTDVELLNNLKADTIFLSANFSSELLGRKSMEIYIDMALRIATSKNILTIAENIDDRSVLTELTKRGCKRAHGKIIANAMNLHDFTRLISPNKDRMTG